jgi:D-3-phosphoglycerate dehydrogenase / 2-oxoglutarate reductase
MSGLKVVITDSVFPNLDPEHEILEPLGAEIVAGQCKSKSDALALVPGAVAVLNTYYGPIDAEVMDAMPGCRAIVRYGIGVDTIEIPAATARGIMVANVPDYCIEEVSDQAVAMLLALLRKLPLADKRVRRGQWELAGLKPLRRLCDLTLGIVGMGRIGRALVRKLAPFGARLVFADPYYSGEAPAGTEQIPLSELLQVCDGILLQAPATPETRHLLNADSLALMEKSPVVVNCARGELVDTAALVAALESGQISGAGLDVIEGAPPLPENSPLLCFDNVLLAPHSAWFSDAALGALQRLATEEVARVLRGERPKSLLNPEVLNR